MTDIRFATEQTPEQVAAQVQQEQEAAQKRALDEHLKATAADGPAPAKQGALPAAPGFVGYLTQYI